MTSNEYYEELYDTGRPHVQAGWRHPFEQAMRFAIACDLPQVPGGTGALLDVGCGPGDLYDYLRRTDWFDSDEPASLYLGVDRLPRAIQLARERWTSARFECADITAPAYTTHAETVMAIGAMISGEPCEASARMGRVRTFVRQCVARSTRQGVIIMLDQGALDARPALGMEPALFGVRRGAELDALVAWLAASFDVDVTVRGGGLVSDVVLYWQRRAQSCAPLHLRADEALIKEVFSTLDASRTQLFWRGWLYAEMGQVEQAERVLRECMEDDRQEVTTRQRAKNLWERLML